MIFDLVLHAEHLHGLPQLLLLVRAQLLLRRLELPPGLSQRARGRRSLPLGAGRRQLAEPFGKLSQYRLAVP